MVLPHMPWNKTDTHRIKIHLPSRVVASPSLISSERYDWLHNQHHAHNPSTDSTSDLTKLMQRYHPRTNRRNPQDNISKTTNQWALLPSLTSAIHACFDTICEIFANRLHKCMNPDVDYCNTFQEDAIFGAHFDAFSYR